MPPEHDALRFKHDVPPYCVTEGSISGVKA
jgi:hypothetical protein